MQTERTEKRSKWERKHKGDKDDLWGGRIKVDQYGMGWRCRGHKWTMAKTDLELVHNEAGRKGSKSDGGMEERDMQKMDVAAVY